MADTQTQDRDCSKETERQKHTEGSLAEATDRQGSGERDRLGAPRPPAPSS